MLSRPHAMLIGRRLVMSTVAYAAGRIRLGAYLNGRPLGSCHSRSPARRTFTCRLTLPARVSLSARIAIVASLVVHGRKFAAHRAPAVIPQMRMRPIGGSGARAAAASLGFWCSPSALRGVLVPGG
jgi:hypothetical protein